MTVALDCTKLTVFEKIDASVEISYPVGAVNIILFVKLTPETLTVCVADATPVQAVKAENVPDVVIVGGGMITNSLRVASVSVYPSAFVIIAVTSYVA